jgi:Spy/CpxP family protein refolding chaperone
MTTTMKRLGLGAGAAVLALGLGGSAYLIAQERPGGPGRFGGPGGPGGRPGGIVSLPLRQLNLSDSQEDRVRSIVQSHEAALKEIATRAADARRLLNEAIVADTVDEGLIRARAAEVATVEADMAVLRARIGNEVFQVLTPEQQTRARELRTQMQERAGRARQRLQGRGRI